MIDINELRRKVNSTDIVDHIDLHVNVKPFLSELIDRLEAAESECLEEARLNGTGSEREAALMAKMEAAEKTNREWLRANAPGGWIDNLRVENETLAANLRGKHRIAGATYTHLIAERDELRAKIEAMEQQEPVAWVVPPSSRPHWGEHAMQDAAWESRQCGGTAKAEPLYALPGAQNVPEKLCYDSRWEIAIDYVDGWNAAVDMMRGKSPSWHCPDCCIAFPFGAPKSCPNDDARCNSLLAAAPETKP